MTPEITINDEFGRTIYKVIKKYKPNTILEIGSGNGFGSTTCIINALNDEKIDISKFICLENCQENIKDLLLNIKRCPKASWNDLSSISYNSFLPKDFDKDVWNSPYNKITSYSKELVKCWYDRDVEYLKQIKIGFLDQDDTRWDVVLIDGGEFNGYSEYTLLKERTNIFLLDDVHYAYKCNRIYTELSNDKNWELLFSLPHVRNGAAGFRRII